ncbi:hypothetical protein [Streptomyces sp. NPDC058644]|uniref:hypothetical protein n=1 Tax=unclassified Streptomyces TaxID=2593676 RepID=UPI003650B16C
MKVYNRTENGTTTQVSVREGLTEINHAQMDGKRAVRTMSSITRTDFAIEYKDGRKVRLIQVDAPEEAAPDHNIMTHTGKVHAPGRHYRQLRGKAPKCCASVSAVMRYHFTAPTSSPVDCQRCLAALAKESGS